MKRRPLFKSAIAAGVMGTTFKAFSQSVETPAQTQGPFYPESWNNENDLNLRQFRGLDNAKGQGVNLRILVLNTKGDFISSAVVELWQANHFGRYNHSQDPNTDAPLDPGFQYWGRGMTNSEGSIDFKTIKPGAYPADGSWIRPPHFHLKVIVPGVKTLTTQLYFAGEAENRDDKILGSLTPEQQSLVTIKFVPESNPSQNLVGTAKIYINVPGGALLRTPELD